VAAPGAGLTLLDGGTEAYPRMLAAIDRAAREVHLEVFIFRRDRIGRRFEAALAAAAGRGVHVRVVLDGWGSAIDGRAIAAQLTAAGCDVRIYHRLRSLLRARFRRDHRKLLAVDDEVAFVGGINIGDEYDGERADVAVELRGPAVPLFWAALGGERPGTGPLRVLLSGPGGSWALRRRYLKAIRGARDHVLLAQGYFLPDPLLLRALKRAARRGVKVTVLVAARTDVWFTRLATRQLYRQLQAAGVEVREYVRSTLHAKAAVVDARTLLVGSFNLDPASLFNLEALVEADDAAAAAQGELWMRARLAESRPVEPQERSVRAFVANLAGQMFLTAGQWLMAWAERQRRLSRREPASGGSHEDGHSRRNAGSFGPRLRGAGRLAPQADR